MPKSKHGSNAITTVIMTRLESIASCMWTPDVDTVLGVNRKESIPSNTEWSGAKRPPSLNVGRARSSNFFNGFIVWSYMVALWNIDIC